MSDNNKYSNNNAQPDETAENIVISPSDGDTAAANISGAENAYENDNNLTDTGSSVEKSGSAGADEPTTDPEDSALPEQPESFADGDSGDIAPDSIDNDSDDFADDDTSASKSDFDFDVTDSTPDEFKSFELDPPGSGEQHDSGASIKRFAKPVLTGACAVAAAVLVMYIICMICVPTDKMMRNVYIEDIDVGGKTYDEALQLVSENTLLGDQTINVTCGEMPFEIKGSDIGMTAKLEETVQKAMDIGKSGNRLADGFENFKQIFKRHTVIPTSQVDENLLIQKVNEIGISIYGEMQKCYIDIKTDEPNVVVWPGVTGYDPSNPDSYTGACQLITESLRNDIYDGIELTLYASAPPQLTIEEFDATVYKDPVSARYEIDGNTVNILPDETGRYINKDEAAALLATVTEGGPAVTIPYYVSTAEETADVLQAKLFAVSLGSYSTSYGGSTANRAANVARAAELINGTVLAPGETFSFNDTVGDRTVENGFYTAKEYIDGKSVDGIGGGTCQVSSTLYSAVLYADLSIVHRECHMMSVGYMPLGQDATVAYGSVDFKFKNSSDYPIKISAYTSGGTITVSILGTAWEPERSVELSHSTTTSGQNTIVTSTRYVYSNGELISTDNLGQSVYKPHTSG